MSVEVFSISYWRKKYQYETKAAPQPWTWRHHPPSQSRFYPQMAIYGCVHPSKDWHSLKNVPCGLNCSLFEFFSLNLVSWSSFQVLWTYKQQFMVLAVKVKVQAQTKILYEYWPNCVCSIYYQNIAGWMLYHIIRLVTFLTLAKLNI